MRPHHALSPLLCLAPLFAQTWQPASPPATPPARLGAAMVADVAHGQCLLFGGWSGTGYLGDTWSFDGANWSPLVGSGPVARTDHAMAFDEVRGVAVLFGGINGVAVSSYRSDTWEHDATGWHARAAATHPSARFGHAMAYDRVRAVVVLFGGRTNAGTIFTNDTWEWNGTSWTPRTPAHAPGNRMGHAMAFDATSGRVLLFGGQPLGGLPLGDTWTFDGVDWTQLSPATAPSPRTQAAMALDDERGRVVLYGGYQGGDLLDTHEWNGTDWALVPTPTQPNAPGLPAIAGGPHGQNVLLFGGELGTGAPLAATWWFGALAGTRSFGSGCGPTALQLVANDLPVLGQTQTSRVTQLPTGALALLALGLSDSQWNGLPLPLPLDPLGMPGCSLYQDMLVIDPCLPNGLDALHTFAVPASPALAGFLVHTQACALANGVNAAGLVTSNAMTLVLGFASF